jgi:ABC-type branched-subunit amino acid transport system ATPase component
VIPDITLAIGAIRAELIAESNLRRVLEHAGLFHVLERGEIVSTGPPEALRRDAAAMAIVAAA